MKKIIILIFTVIVLNISVVFAETNDSDIANHLFNNLSTDTINEFVTNVNRELEQDIPYLNIETVKKTAANGIADSIDEWWQKLVSYFFRELAANIHLLGKLLFLAVLCAMLQNLQNSFEQSGVSVLAYGVCFIFLSVIALTAFYNAISLAKWSVETMVSFMEALLPLLITLLAGVGAVTSAALFTPLMLFVISTVSVVVKDIVLPLLLFTAILDCVNYITAKYKIDNLVSLFKQVGMFILGITLVIFIGIVSIQGVAGSVADGITLRTAKYATGTFIPVVGKMFADTVELVMGASLLLKNCIGIFGVIAIITICIFPLVKLLSLIMILKIAGVLVQPMGDEKMARCLDSMGNNLLLIFGAVMTVALMMFLSITMIVGVGSIAVMLR